MLARPFRLIAPALFERIAIYEERFGRTIQRARTIRALAEQLRTRLATCDHGAITARREVTVSIGVAEGHRATGFQKLYGMADRALYDAKRLGRNRVVVFGQSTAQADLDFARDQLGFDFN